jgi:hypothetical protein
MDELIAQCHSRFSHFEEDDFANWLESGFRVYHNRFEGNQIGPDQPFGFVSGFIGFGDSLLDDLTLIFLNLVPEDQKTLFRKSIARLLMKVVSRDDFPLEAVRELIYLIERVGASESLSCLATVVQTGRYGAPSEWLQVDAIRVLKQMLGSDKAVDGLYDIAALGAFKVELSFDVLEALCRYVPTDWPLHVMALSDKTGQWYQKAELAAGDVLEEFLTYERQFIETFEKEVTLPRITRMMHDFLDRRPSLTTVAKRWVDDRFVKALDKGSGVVQSVIAEQIRSKSGFGITPQINSVLPKLRPPMHDDFERNSPSATI